MNDEFDKDFQKIREGSLYEALIAFESLRFKAGRYDRMRGDLVSDEEKKEWKELKLSYSDISNRKAAVRIKAETDTRWSTETIRRVIG